MGTEQLGEATDGPQDGPEPRRLGRRALVGGALASGAGIAAVMVGAKKASATNGGSVILGQVNTASATTAVSTSVGNGLEGDTSGSGAAGVYGNDTSPTLGSAGVWGNSVHGYGVYGISQNYNAVYGSSSNAHSVFGEQTTDGYAGVYGDDESTGGGQRGLRLLTGRPRPGRRDTQRRAGPAAVGPRGDGRPAHLRFPPGG
jgi:hypothetical protein